MQTCVTVVTVTLLTLQVDERLGVLLRQAAQALELTAPVGDPPAALPSGPHRHTFLMQNKHLSEPCKATGNGR